MFKFLQFSDLHLDSNLSGSRLSYGEAKARQRQQELRDALVRICRLAAEERVDAVLAPGDLMDDEICSLETVNFMKECFAGLAPIPVLIAPGNHDYYSETSMYNSALLVAQRQTPWPDNVHIFTETGFTVYALPARPDVSITGICHARNRECRDRLLAAPVPRGDGQFRILLYHGARVDYIPDGQQVTLPFSDEELLAQDFHYAAIGHYHVKMEIRDAGNRIRAAYSGVPAGRVLSEAGEKCVLLGQIEDDGAVTLEPRRVDPRVIHHIHVDVTGAQSHETVEQRIQDAVRSAGVAPEDIVYVQLTGRFPSGTVLQVREDVLTLPVFHVRIDLDGVLPDYNLDDFTGSGGELATTEQRFVNTLRERLARSVDDEEHQLITDALYYGLDALVHEKVQPRHGHS